MKINYSISLWNYFHYMSTPSLERIINFIFQQGYGIEFWSSWREEHDLYDEIGVKRLKCMLSEALKQQRTNSRNLENLPQVSLHTVGKCNEFALHKKQIDAARALGAKVVVNHPDDFFKKGKTSFDDKLCKDAVSYAKEKGVQLALENGEFLFLLNAIKKVEDLRICIDIGHIYLKNELLLKYLNAFKNHIIHLHLQDVLSKVEQDLPNTGKDHFICGTGGIPQEDWNLLIKTLKEINYNGIAVFEIQPRNPLQTALLSKSFIESFIK